MNNFSEFSLTAYDLSILHDKAFFEAKHQIMHKWEQFLTHLAQKIQEWASFVNQITLPDEVKQTTPKISKGENYQGMPYMVLDYPRYFGKEDTCAFRNILLWNRGLYSTWLFEGKYMDYAVQNYKQYGSSSMYLHQNEDKWVHELTPQDIYIQTPESFYCETLLEKTKEKLHYLKFSNFVSFQEWNILEQRSGLPLPVSSAFHALMNFIYG